MPRYIFSTVLLSAAALTPALVAQTKFMDPTHDELTMTSYAGYPGVAAVILNRDEVTRDNLQTATHYSRIKILTEDGKKYANVELPYVSTNNDFSDGFGVQKSLEQIQGRTIHPDGTVIPFAGKPYDKVLEKGKGIKVQAKVFTLPDVTVGSIIEYRYTVEINAFGYEPPVWIIQGDLPIKSAHFLWYPTTGNILDEHNNRIQTITSFPILPKGVQLVKKELWNPDERVSYELNIKDVPPIVADEEYMPPLANYTYRVYFNYIAAATHEEFWKSEGRYWSKSVNSFANPNSDLKAATQQIVAGAATQDQKLRAIYASVQKFENTDYTRAHDTREDKASGLGKVNNAGDVFKRQRGNSTQIAELFIAMARAAGMQADAMLVPDRSREFFIPEWLDMNQFDDTIAIVNVDGKEQYFDPGSRYCPYGHLAWQHNFVTGLRQKGNETAFENVPGDGHKSNVTVRVANLDMVATGHVTGKIDMLVFGAPALRWRHTALRGDDESLKHELRSSLEELLPHSLEVKDVTVSNLTDYEQPLKVSYNVEGTIGSWTGKRLVLPADLFRVNQKATFPHEKREVAVDFLYPQQIRDTLRVNFPADLSIEAAPSAANFNLKQMAAYGMTVDTTTTNFTTRRDYVEAENYILPDEYPDLRTFYSKFETNDQQSIVLKATVAPATKASTAQAAN